MAITQDLRTIVKRIPERHDVKLFRVPAEQEKNIKDELAESLQGQLDGLRDALENSLKSDLKYTYPGSGIFDFKNVMFSGNGDVLVDIKYKRHVLLVRVMSYRLIVPSSSVPLGSMIVIPDPYAIREPQRPKPISGGETRTSQPHPTTTLSWKVTEKAAASRKERQLITVTGKNDTKESVYMESIQLSFFVYKNFKVLTGGNTTLTTIPFFIQTADFKQNFESEENFVRARDEPVGSLDLQQLQVVPQKKSETTTKCNFTIQSKKAALEILAGGSVIVDFALETGPVGLANMQVDETERTKDGERKIFEGHRNGKLWVKLA